MKTYVCRKLYLYYYLSERGFRPFQVCPDIHNVDRHVWLYTETPEILRAVNQYYEEMPARIAAEQKQK